MVISSHKGVAGPFVPDLHFASDRLLSLPATPGRLKDEIESVERSVIEAALRENQGEINATYRALGISRRALYERMKKYQLDREEFR
jgi:DNA-binding NtrC family response regulator